MRAIEFSREASNFGLSDEQAYGIWDYRLDRTPRLVQAGRWALEGDLLTLTPTEDLTEGKGRVKLRIYKAPLGILSIDDPLQGVIRPFARTAVLPDISRQSAPKTMVWLDEDRDKPNPNASTITHFKPAEDKGAWLVASINGLGSVGGREFHFDFDANPVNPSRLYFNVIAYLDADRTYTHFYENHTREPWVIHDIIPGFDSLRVIGVLNVGRTAEFSVGSTISRGPGDVLTVSDKIPWPEDTAAGTLNKAGVSLAATADGGVLMTGARLLADEFSLRDGHFVVIRLTQTGDVAWETDLGRGVQVHAMSHDDAAQAVYVAGRFQGTLQTDAGAVDDWGVNRLFVARLNLESGKVEAVRGLGAGGQPNDFPWLMATLPGGGFGLLAGRQAGVAFNAGAGTVPIVGLVSDQSNWLLTSFTTDLEARWTAGIQGLAPAGFSVDDDGAFTVGDARGRTTHVRGLPLEPWQYGNVALRFSPCGQLLPGLRVDGGFTVVNTFQAPTGQLFVSGGTTDDIHEPPYWLQFSGSAGTPNTPGGNQSPVAMVLAQDVPISGDAAACTNQPQTQSPVRVRIPQPDRGRVVSTPPGIDCPGVCEATFDDLGSVTLQATAATGYSFAGFSPYGAPLSHCTSEAECTFIVTGDTSILALFEPVTVEWRVPISLEYAISELIATQDGFALLGKWGEPLETRTGQTIPAGANLVFFGIDGAIDRAFPLPATAMDVVIDPTGRVAFTNHDRVVVYSALGEPLWSQPLPQLNAHGTLAFVQGQLVVAWSFENPGDVALDGLESVSGLHLGAMIATFDTSDGTPLAVKTVAGPFMPPIELILGPDDTFTLHNIVDATYPSPPGFDLPAAARGGVFLTYDTALNLVGAVRLRAEDRALTARYTTTHSVGPAPGQSPTKGDIRRDPYFRPLWMLETGIFDATHAYIGNLGNSFGLNMTQVASGMALTIVRLNNDGKLDAAWANPWADDVVVYDLLRLGQDQLVAMVTYHTQRDGPGGAILSAQPDRALVSLRFKEAP